MIYCGCGYKFQDGYATQTPEMRCPDCGEERDLR